VNVDFTPDSWREYTDWLKEDRKMLLRINTLIKEILRDPFDGIGKPEPLRSNLAGFWSRRIDQKHRLIYQIQNGRCLIVQCKGHYGE